MSDRLYGIDVSGWQSDTVDDTTNYDFVIVKATEGTTYISGHLGKQTEGALKRGKLLGIYHFASGKDAKAEAAHFVKSFKPYVGKAIPVLDYEASATSKGREWCRAWMQEVQRLTGIMPWLYSYYAVSKSQKLPELCNELNAGFWLAQYWSNDRIDGYNPPARGPAIGCDCWQYTSNGYISGYGSRLDCNVFYGSAEAWMNYCGAGAEVPKPDNPSVGNNAVSPQVVSDVLKGKYGNTPERPANLKKAGYDYDAVQKAINTLLAEIMVGKWGNGAVRKQKLQKAGYDYDAVQSFVNANMKK